MIDSLKAQEKALFSEWRAIRSDLVTDGIVDESAWLATSPRILLVMKEVNSDGRGNWDLVDEILKTGNRAPTWDVVTRWLRALRDRGAPRPWIEMEKVDQPMRQDVLRSIAVMNIKKSPGGHTANDAELSTAATKDRELLRRQFFLYEPDLAIGCGKVVVDELDRDGFVDTDRHSKWQSTSRGVWYREYLPGKFLIEYQHPEARTAPYILHYPLVEAVNEIRSKHGLAW